MESWQEDLFSITENDAQTEQQVFKKIEIAAQALGFSHCAYGLRLPTPISNPKIVMLNNYSESWKKRYASAGYLHIDPTVLHGRRTQTPLVWHNQAFATAPKFWDEAQSFGLCVGWAQSSLDAIGVGGMLTLSRPADALSASELAVKQVKMRWLVHVAHLSLSRIFTAQKAAQIPKLPLAK
jgi:hypothetical protein